MRTRHAAPLAIAIVFIAVTLSATTGAESPRQNVQLPTHYLWAIGGVDGPGRFSAATRVEATPGGELYLTDETGVQVLAADGTFLRMWGGPGHGDAQFDRAAGVAVVATGGIGRVLVADTANGRVQGFDADGRYRGALTGWPDTRRPGSQRPLHAVDVAIAGDGSIFAGDGLDSWIVHFDADGGFLAAWGGPGTAPGQVAILSALTLAPDGTVWVGDRGIPGRVHAFTQDGTLIRRWEVAGGVRDLAATATAIYVVDGAGTLRTFAPDGTPIGASATPPEPMPWPAALSVTATADGNAVLLCESSAATGPAQLVWTNLERETLATVTSAPPAPGAMDPVAVDMDHEDALYVADAAAGLGQVVVLNADGTLRATWPDGGGGIDLIRSPVGIARMPLSSVYVTEPTLGQVVVLDDQGRVTGRLGAPGPMPGGFGAAGPGDVAASHELSSQPKRVFVTDPSNARVVAFDDQGKPAGTFGSAGEAAGQFIGAPTHLASSPQGRVYVTDMSATQRVQVFDYTGDFVRLFHGVVGEDSRFAPLTGVDYGAGSTVFLGDPRQRVQAFSRDGALLGQWDVHASRPDLAVEPGEVVAGRDSRVYVADRAARRVHVFGATRPLGWRQETYANPWLAEAPRAVGWVPEARLSWGSGAPGPDLPADGFSVRLARFMELDAGWYLFTVEADGAVRLRVDEHLSIDDWHESTSTTWASALVAAGEHYIQLEYADLDGLARVSLRIDPLPAGDTRTPGALTATPPPATSPPPPATSTVTATATIQVTAPPGGCPDHGCAVCLPLALDDSVWPAP